MDDPAKPLTILITRLSHIGDCLLTLPLLNAVRDRFPRARLAWLVEPPADQLLQGHPALDEMIVLGRSWRRSPRAILAIRHRLHALSPQVTLDPQSLTKSALFAWLSGAPRRLGFCPPEGGELAPWLNNVHVATRCEHLLDRSLELLPALTGDPGSLPSSIRFDLRLKESAVAAGREIRRTRHLMNAYYVINPGASWASKRWPTDRYGRVARHLGQLHQWPALVTWAGDHEKQMAEEIVARSGGHAVLAPETCLQVLAALLEGARFFLGSDTGPMHLAVAVGTRCVALFGPTRAAASGPYGTQHICLQNYYQEGSRRVRRRASDDAMRAISVDAVIAGCERLMRESGRVAG